MMNDVGATARCRSTALARRRLAADDGAATARERRRQPARRPWRRQRQQHALHCRQRLHMHHADSISLPVSILTECRLV